jgi:hypothetical protein
MSLNYIDFEKKIVEGLKASKLFKRFPNTRILQSPSLDVIIKAFEEPSEIFVDDHGLYFVDENDNKIYCPDMLTSVSEKGEWLSDKIPYVDFDIDQNGNVRKAEEAEALFCAIIVANCLNDDYFKNELTNVAKQYDFIGMKPINDECLTFSELLNEWQQLQSVTINVLISASKYRIADVKKDVEKYLRDGLSDIQVGELRELESSINAINDKYSKGILSPDSVRQLTKAKRLEEIDNRDREISQLLKKSKAGTLYRVLNLSSEYISPIKKKKIALWVRNEIDSLLNSDESFADLREERSQLISRFQRRAIKMEKNSIRKLNVERLIEEKEYFNFPAKL